MSSCRTSQAASVAVSRLTTDAHKAYLEAAENAFGADIDLCDRSRRYMANRMSRDAPLQPCQCIGSDMKVVTGDPIRRTLALALWSAESDYENVYAPVHTVDKRLFKESREPCGCYRCDSLHSLQFCAESTRPCGLLRLWLLEFQITFGVMRK